MERKEILKLENISFSYGKTSVLESFSLAVEQGSFTTLLGPSGCGKTTLLRIIAGFLKPSSGRVIINGNDITEVPVEKRPVGFVFQDYALFPHMTVRENMLFGFSGKDKKNHLEELERTAESLEISDLLSRYPHELSGGQQQRVALGRTLMLKPEIILMDEPLSSLDAGLRLKVREELMEIQQKIGVTTVYVTHDREEALSLSTKIAVIKNGMLLQYDSPEEVYFHPAGKECAALTGMANSLCLDGTEVIFRPEWVSFTENENESLMTGKIISSVFLGAVTRYKIETESGLITVDSFDGTRKMPGEQVFLKVNRKLQFAL